MTQTRSDRTLGDVTFFMGMYRDLARAAATLEELRAHFPSERVIVRSDGDATPANRALATKFGVEYYEEERLFPIMNGGALPARMLELHLEQATSRS